MLMVVLCNFQLHLDIQNMVDDLEIRLLVVRELEYLSRFAKLSYEISYFLGLYSNF